MNNIALSLVLLNLLNTCYFSSIQWKGSLRPGKWPYSELFCSVFSRIRTEYRELLRIQSVCGKIRTRKNPNTATFHAADGKDDSAITLSPSFEDVTGLCIKNTFEKKLLSYKR